MGFIPLSGQSKVRLFSLSILTDKIILVVQSCRVPSPRSTGSLVSVYCDQPPLICFGCCGRKAITKQYFFLTLCIHYNFELRNGKEFGILSKVVASCIASCICVSRVKHVKQDSLSMLSQAGFTPNHLTIYCTCLSSIVILFLTVFNRHWLIDLTLLERTYPFYRMLMALGRCSGLFSEGVTS
jgi:hypothetical protein